MQEKELCAVDCSVGLSLGGQLDGGSVDGTMAKKTSFLPQYFLEDLKYALHKTKIREVL